MRKQIDDAASRAPIGHAVVWYPRLNRILVIKDPHPQHPRKRTGHVDRYWRTGGRIWWPTEKGWQHEQD